MNPTPADADLDGGAAPAPVAPPPLLLRVMTAIGSLGLLAATATDALAVLGRHLGIVLLGSIEFVQVTVVLIASAAVIVATGARAHAAVHIVTARLPAPAAAACARAAALLGALLFLVVAAGSAWVAADLWNGAERTELLGLPLRPFRLLWIAATLLVAALFVRLAITGARR